MSKLDSTSEYATVQFCAVMKIEMGYTEKAKQYQKYFLLIGRQQKGLSEYVLFPGVCNA